MARCLHTKIVDFSQILDDWKSWCSSCSGSGNSVLPIHAHVSALTHKSNKQDGGYSAFSFINRIVDVYQIFDQIRQRIDCQSIPGRMFSLVILTSRFEATRGLFWDGPRNFEPRSDDEDDT
ncbi:hypothetical protein AVEN_123779-1 [Araneus ventricosus]|uniref:Uncharacterized protein n=1 Tax=Araneus ventricosus TaxID=182803 RepID=A0A4Y2BK08_ARAVE|nr:hypothetical protein AVEN_123779-1 [Araneus ventricosus]